jgi:hypothetical protein
LSYFLALGLLIFPDKIPGRSPILKALTIGLLAMVIIEVFSTALNPGNAWAYLLIGTVQNIPRFLFLALVVGYECRRIPAERIE